MYPTIFPSNEIKQVVEIIREGKISENAPKLAHCLWIVQGYAQGLFLGDPSIPKSLVASAVPSTEDFDAFAALEKMAESDLSPQIALPWQLIATWALNYLIKLIREEF